MTRARTVVGFGVDAASGQLPRMDALVERETAGFAQFNVNHPSPRRKTHRRCQNANQRSQPGHAYPSARAHPIRLLATVYEPAHTGQAIAAGAGSWAGAGQARRADGAAPHHNIRRSAARPCRRRHTISLNSATAAADAGNDIIFRYTLDAADQGKRRRADVYYTDADGDRKRVEAASVGPVAEHRMQCQRLVAPACIGATGRLRGWCASCNSARPPRRIARFVKNRATRLAMTKVSTREQLVELG